MEFSDKLSLIIKQSKHTKKGFAINCGMNPNQIYNYLNGDQLPGMDFFRKMKRAYPWVSIDDLINEESEVENINNNIEPVIGLGAHELADEEGLYGKTRQREVEGTPLTITEFEPKNGQMKGPLRAAMEGLGEIFDSNDPILIPAIQANIRAFRISARRERQNAQQARQIKVLEDECDGLKERLDALEKKFKDNPAHIHKEEPTKQKAI